MPSFSRLLSAELTVCFGILSSAQRLLIGQLPLFEYIEYKMSETLSDNPSITFSL